MNAKSETLTRAAFFPCLLLVVLAALPLFSSSAEFTGDDFYYITTNPLVTTPDWSVLAEIWRRPMKIEYFPVTITTFALEYRLWGADPRLFHLTNLLIYLGIGCAARAVAIRLATGASPADRDQRQIPLFAGLATLVMICHPVNVESVASIANRKELLYVLFALLSLYCYLSPHRRPAAYCGALVLMVTAQLSKGTAVVLPGLFLCCEMLPVRRGTGMKRFLWPVFAALLAITLFAVQFRVAQQAGVVEKSGAIADLSRAGGVVRSFNVMITKFLVPIDLSYDYDIAWPQGLPSLHEWLLPSAVLGLVLLMGYRRQWGALSLTLMMVLTLIPYANIIPLHHNTTGQMVFYDHYLLFAAMLCAALLTTMLSTYGRDRQQSLLLGGGIAVMVLTGYNSHLYTFWQTRETLYRRIIQVTPNLPKGYLFLGKTLNEKGRHEEAIATLNRIFTLKNWFPTYLEAYREVGNAYAFSGQMPAAESAYRRHLEYQPRDRTTLQNLSAALIEQNKYGDAKLIILTWLTYYPEDTAARYNLQLCEEKLLRR